MLQRVPREALPSMHHLKWSGSEKKVARRAYEAALEGLSGQKLEFIRGMRDRMRRD
jgi:hypothetical protein